MTGPTSERGVAAVFGDDEDWRALYASSYPRLVTQIAAVVGSVPEAEDVVQEAFVRLAARRTTKQPGDNSEAWVRIVALNLARSRWRRARRGLALAIRSRGRDVDVELTPDRVAVTMALRQLPPTQREAIALHYLADMSIADIARSCRVPEGTVKARLSRGRTALAVLLEEREEVDHA